MSERIPLSDLIAQITAEIRKAHDFATETERAIMQFEECEFEFAVEAEKSAEGRIHVWIINLGGGGRTTNSNRVRIKYSKLAGELPMQAGQQSAEGAGPEI
jgi:hypothetical protein